MEKLLKGRPSKAKEKQKRMSYSVWVNEEEKQIIDKMVLESGLPASIFFISQIIEKEIRTPRKKNWPASIAPYMIVINKLAGLLALFGLKTKDKEMVQSKNWIRSSENIKWISTLVMLRVFEEFDFPRLKNSLVKINELSKHLYWQTESLKDTNEEIGKLAGNINKLSDTILKGFELHYVEQHTPSNMKEFWSAEMDVHLEIEKIKTELLKL